MKLIPRENPSDGSKNSGMVPLRDAMSRIFDESMWDPFGLMAHDPFFAPFFQGNRSRTNTPLVDVSEDKEKFLIEADMPGFTADEVDVELEGDTLTLRAQKESSSEDKDDKTYYVRERSSSYWERRFKLPKNVDSENIECEMEDGQLKIHLPKTEEDSTRKIKVKVK